MPWHPPVREAALDLDLVQERRDARQDVPPAEHRLAVLHQVRDGVLAIADALLELRGNERDGLGLVRNSAENEALMPG